MPSRRLRVKLTAEWFPALIGSRVEVKGFAAHLNSPGCCQLSFNGVCQFKCPSGKRLGAVERNRVPDRGDDQRQHHTGDPHCATHIEQAVRLAQDRHQR